MMNDAQRIHQLEIDLHLARTENIDLRKRLSESGRHARRVRQAYHDSLAMVMLYASGTIPSVRYAKTKGISRRRWENAVGLLRQAGIIKHAPGYTWTMTNAADAEWRLDYVRDLSIREPEIYAANLCAHANHGWEIERQRVPDDEPMVHGYVYP